MIVQQAVQWLYQNRLSLILTGICAAVALGLWLYFRWKERQMFHRLNQMLDAAISGVFQETDYNETMLSSVENRMSQFLKRSSRVENMVKEDRDHIKTLISDISHQTRTPVANIRLYTELLKETALPPEGEAYVEALENQTEKLEFLIRSLLKMSRLETGMIQVKPQAGPVLPLLEKVRQQAALKAEKKNVELTVLPTSAQACFDAVWTVEALYNLVDNAIKYTPPGGKVSLQAETLQLFCRIDVADTGMGIKETEQGQIFSRFYRSEDAAEEEGMGVGLYLAREIAAAQGGYIRVLSKKGKGSVFSLFLPGI